MLLIMISFIIAAVVVVLVIEGPVGSVEVGMIIGPCI